MPLVFKSFTAESFDFDYYSLNLYNVMLLNDILCDDIRCEDLGKTIHKIVGKRKILKEGDQFDEARIDFCDDRQVLMCLKKTTIISANLYYKYYNEANSIEESKLETYVRDDEEEECEEECEIEVEFVFPIDVNFSFIGT